MGAIMAVDVDNINGKSVDTAVVSIIIPFYNCEKYIKSCLISVRRQTLQDWEAIVVDDHSTDDSLRIVSVQAEADTRIRIISNQEVGIKKKGAAWARNLGIKSAKGRWIAFLDADDVWHPHKLSLQVEALTGSSCNFCVSSYARFNEDNRQIRSIVVPPQDIDKKLVGVVNVIPMSSVMLERNLLRKQSFRAVAHEDHDLWKRLFDDSKVKYICVPEVLVGYRVHGSNTTRGAWKRILLKKQYLIRERELRTVNILRLVLHYVRQIVVVRSRVLFPIDNHMIQMAKEILVEEEHKKTDE